MTIHSAAPDPTSLVYAVHNGSVLHGDLYLPNGIGPHPVVLAVPGGGWRVSKRTGLRHWAEFLRDRGIATFAIEYRTAAEGASFPHAAQDVIAALEFVRGEAARLCLDSSRLSIVAASAGAHLAALATFAAEVPPFRGAYPEDPHSGLRPEIRALVLAYGVYDMVAHWRQTRVGLLDPADDVTEQFMGVALGVAPELYLAASPTHYLARNDRPPGILLTWGTEDRIVNPAQSSEFSIALRGSGLEVEECPVSGAGHHWFSTHPIADPAGFTHQVAPRVARFLTERLDAESSGVVRSATGRRAES